MSNEEKMIYRTKGIIEACEEIRAIEGEKLGEQAMIVAYLHIKSVFEEEGEDK